MTQIVSNAYMQKSLVKQPTTKVNHQLPQQKPDSFTRQTFLEPAITFTGKSKVNVRKIFKQNPGLEEVINKSVQGDLDTYALFSHRLDEAKLHGRDRDAVVTHFADKLYESAYKEPTMNKAIIIAKGNGSGRVVQDFLNDVCLQRKHLYDMFSFKMNKAKKQAEQARQVLNQLLNISDKEIRSQALSSIKAKLVQHVDPQYNSTARITALNTLNAINLAYTKSDLTLYIKAVKNYQDETRKVAISNLSSVLEKYLKNNKKDLEPVEIRNAAIQCINALNYVRAQEGESGSTKRLATRCREEILNSKAIPQDIRKDIVEEVYKV